jgi:non-ribosomal peptide synthetase component F
VRAIYARCSAALVVAVCGILRAGAAYLILDARYPAAYLMACLRLA